MSSKIFTRFFFAAAMLVALTFQLNSQVISGISRSDVSRELQSRGISEIEFEKVLNENGMTLDSIEYYSAQKITELQSVILQLERNADLGALDTIPKESDFDTGIELDDEMTLDSTLIDTLPIEDEVIERYGRSLFVNGNFGVSTEPFKSKAPPSYILGVGDELAISVWGSSKVDDLHEISESGFIEIVNGAVRVYLKGLRLQEAKSKLRDAYRQYYRFGNGQFDVNVSYARTVQVNVYGEVQNPGPQSLPAINNVFSVISAAGGPSKIGTVRYINIIRADGSRSEVDLFKYMEDVQQGNNIYLQDNDVVFVGPFQHLVEITGGINRPYKYELKSGESLGDLIGYAGGFDINAQVRNIRIVRNELDAKKVIDVEWPKDKNVKLENGDLVEVNSIERILESFVRVEGAVLQEGYYELENRMRLSDLLNKAGVKNEARTDIAFIKRVALDSTISYLPVDLKAALENTGSEANIFLSNKDELTIWFQNRFSDKASFKIDGAIREPGSFEFGTNDNIRLTDAILLGGGLRRDASSVLMIHKQDPLNEKVKRYFTVTDINQIIDNPNNLENIYVEPFDSIFVYSQNEFLEDATVTIRGAVNKPGKFQYGLEMTIKDIFTLAGGFKLSAATDQIEISRVEITNNQPTRVVVANIEMDRAFNVLSSADDFKLEPNDVITVRYVPEFEQQKTIEIFGEVKYPGPYTILNDTEKISNIIKRAGGLTEEAFPAGATLNRKDENLGAVVIKLDDILNNTASEFNFVVKDGDRIEIPKLKEFVTIEGATRAKTMLSDDAINLNNRIHVPFESGKRAMFYINEYAGGLGVNADRRSIFVEYPNGEIKKSQAFLFFTQTPKIRKGSIIKVRKKVEEEEKENEETTDWSKVLQDTVAQAVTIITLVLAIQGLN